MSDMIILLLEIAIEELLERMIAALEMNWQGGSAGFNPGQLSIYLNNLLDALQEWELNAAGEWPWVDAYDYVDFMFSAYDAEVMERAFSDTIYGPTGQMEEYAYIAQELQELIEFLQAAGI